MEDIKELKKWREYYKNQWLKTGRDVYKKKHVELEKQIQAIEHPEKDSNLYPNEFVRKKSSAVPSNLERIYAASMSELVDESLIEIDGDGNIVKKHDSNLNIPMEMVGGVKGEVGMTGDVYPNMKMGKTIKVPDVYHNKEENFIRVTVGSFDTNYEFNKAIEAWLKTYDKVEVLYPQGNKAIYKKGKNGITSEMIYT